MQMVMRKITGQVQSGDFFVIKSYQKLKDDYFFAVTVVDIVDGTAYLFDNEPLSDRRNWKAELELEQFRHVLELEQEGGGKESE